MTEDLGVVSCRYSNDITPATVGVTVVEKTRKEGKAVKTVGNKVQYPAKKIGQKNFMIPTNELYLEIMEFPESGKVSLLKNKTTRSPSLEASFRHVCAHCL